MPTVRAVRVGPALLWIALAATSHLVRAPVAGGSPYEYLPVGDPLEAELRILDVLGPADPGHALHLPRLGMRPLQRFELDSLPTAEPGTDPARRIALLRIGRVQARELPGGPPADLRGYTPRLFQLRAPGGTSFELSTGFEGAAEFSSRPPRYASGSGFRGRIALETERWIAYSNLILGYVDSARTFADAFIRNHDVIWHTEESYLGYTGAGGRWGIQFGRTRWHWGPGEEGSLLLSRTSVALTGLAIHVRMEALHADGTALQVTLREAAGEQLAAHRLEWQPSDGVRLGLSEAARYRSTAWQPLYLVGVIPYVMVQRLVTQDEPDSSVANRNNIMFAMDLAWRVAPGTRLYGEWLADDLHSHSDVPNKYGLQLGWEGVGTIRGTRVTWGGEYTRITPFVYSSYFGRDYIAQGKPLGFPIAPDVRRIRVRAAWDPSTDWQLSAVAARTEKGENLLGTPYVPGSPPVPSSGLTGVVEKTRDLEGSVRWWPAGGVDLAMTLGYEWIDQAGHVPGARERGARGTFAVRVAR